MSSSLLNYIFNKIPEKSFLLIPWKTLTNWFEFLNPVFAKYFFLIYLRASTIVCVKSSSDAQEPERCRQYVPAEIDYQMKSRSQK